MNVNAIQNSGQAMGRLQDLGLLLLGPAASAGGPVLLV